MKQKEKEINFRIKNHFVFVGIHWNFRFHSQQIPANVIKETVIQSEINGKLYEKLIQSWIFLY